MSIVSEHPAYLVNALVCRENTFVPSTTAPPPTIIADIYLLVCVRVSTVGRCTRWWFWGTCTFSALTRLGGRKGIWHVKNWVVGCYFFGAMCRFAYGPADATVSCFSKIQIGFTFLVPAHPGSPGHRAVKRVCDQKSSDWLWRPPPKWPILCRVGR